MSFLEKAYLVVMFPIAVLMLIVEPIWVEIVRFYHENEIIKNYKSGWADFRRIYFEEFNK